MTTISGVVDYTKWRSLSDTSLGNNSLIVSTSGSKEIPNDSYQSSQETCTDGKDDGKIGLFQAVFNAGKGVLKTVTNGIKSMVTDSEGHFSLGKTLLSVGTAALCIAFPAVGLVACGLGVAAGAVQVGKGFYNAVTADTDAEAKEAWQNIGGGAFTTGLSILGAKASYGAVKATSTATNGLSSVSNDASLLTKGRALLADMKSSTVNQFGKIKTYVTSSLSTSKQVKAEVKQLNQMKKASARAHAKQAKGKNLSEAELKAISDWENLSTPDSTSHFSEAALGKVKSSRNIFTKQINKGFGKIGDAASGALKAVKHPIKSLKSIPSGISSGAKAVIQAIKSTDASYAELVKKYGYENVAEVIELFGGSTIASESI